MSCKRRPNLTEPVTRAANKTNPLGDCFVIVNPAGLWWTGADWSRDRSAARRFGDEPDPHRDAQEELDRLRATGYRCWLLYLTAQQSQVFFRCALVKGAG